MRSPEKFTTEEHAENQLPARRGAPMPLFYTANGAAMPLEGQYGGDAFLVLNGPSLAVLPMLHQLTGAAYTMTVNNGPRTIRGHANVMLDGPDRFSMSHWLDASITKFAPITHRTRALFDNRLLDDGQKWGWSNTRPCDCPNVVYFKRTSGFKAETFLREPAINWGATKEVSAGRSVMLAAIRILHVLGFRRIFLFGADFHMEPENRYHFPIESNAASSNGNNQSYEILQGRFQELRPIFERAGLEIINATPGSRLTAFKAMEPEEALRLASQEKGRWKEERTIGMYDDAAKTALK